MMINVTWSNPIFVCMRCKGILNALTSFHQTELQLFDINHHLSLYISCIFRRSEEIYRSPPHSLLNSEAGENMTPHKETRDLKLEDLYYAVREWRSSWQVVEIHITKGECAEDCAVQNYTVAKFKG